MKVPMQWIRQYTDIPVTPEEFESAMIMHGTGVEGLDNQNDAVQNVVVGKILSVRKHENSDHMVICSVDVGENAPIANRHRRAECARRRSGARSRRSARFCPAALRSKKASSAAWNPTVCAAPVRKSACRIISIRP